MQQPTIGRTVHFTSPTDEGGDTYAAIITKVHGGGCVDLVTFGSRSVYFHESVNPGDDNGNIPVPGRWNWPPRV